MLYYVNNCLRFVYAFIKNIHKQFPFKLFGEIKKYAQVFLMNGAINWTIWKCFSLQYSANQHSPMKKNLTFPNLNLDSRGGKREKTASRRTAKEVTESSMNFSSGSPASSNILNKFDISPIFNLQIITTCYKNFMSIDEMLSITRCKTKWMCNWQLCPPLVKNVLYFVLHKDSMFRNTLWST